MEYMNKSRVLCIVTASALLLMAQQVFAGGRSDQAGRGRKAVPIKGNIILATTTSTHDSGLLDFILPVFTAETGWTVDVVSVGTGAALQMGREGQADVLLVHSKAQEIQFIADGHGFERFDVMHNDFILVGPRNPIARNSDINRTFKTIAERHLPFVSRGDNSGTHVMELGLWSTAGVDVKNLLGYVSVGQGMGSTLHIANEVGAYTLTDRATWLRQGGPNLSVVCEKDEVLLNYYGVIAVNPAKSPKINAAGAQDFVKWILSPATQNLIGSYGMAEFGDALFTPNAK